MFFYFGHLTVDQNCDSNQLEPLALFIQSYSYLPVTQMLSTNKPPYDYDT